MTEPEFPLSDWDLYGSVSAPLAEADTARAIELSAHADLRAAAGGAALQHVGVLRLEQPRHFYFYRENAAGDVQALHVDGQTRLLKPGSFRLGDSGPWRDAWLLRVGDDDYALNELHVLLPSAADAATVGARACVRVRVPSRVRVLGFGSLLAKESALRTMPSLDNFRVGRVDGFRRVFAQAADVFFRKGLASLETGEFASQCIEPHEGSHVCCASFDFPRKEVSAFYERELEFIFQYVPIEFDDGTTAHGIVCAAGNNEHVWNVVCRKDEKVFESIFGRFGLTPEMIWNCERALPCRQYLAFCVRAARRHGKTVYENFLDANLVDRKTTVREHLKADPTIMAEPPAAHYDPDGSLTREVDKLFEKDRAASD